ncbi:Adenosine deaminase-like protein A like [Verticillium longisporum]|nr:Adenosine deaminase-like protein A like [Verticillium longisporum]
MGGELLTAGEGQEGSTADMLGESLGAGKAEARPFFPLFSSYIYGLLPDAASLTRATRSVLDDFAADGVRYLELRTTPRRTTEMTKEVYVRTVVAAIQAWEADQTTSPTTGSSALRMHTRLILSIDRRDALPEAHEVLRIADLLRRESDMIVGIDLCGDPAKRTPSDPRGSVAIFTDVFREAKAMGFGVTVHFAEAEYVLHYIPKGKDGKAGPAGQVYIILSTADDSPIVFEHVSKQSLKYLMENCGFGALRSPSNFKI